MNKQIFTFFTVILAIYLNSVQAASLSVDMVPGGNVDGTLAITSGSTFDVNILINDVQDLAGFQFELGFDSSVLEATSIVSGNIFGADTLLFDSTILANAISFSEATLAISGNNYSTSTLLATIVFKAVGTGSSGINLVNPILIDSNGDPIAPVSSNDGLLTSALAAPLPAAVWLFASALLGLIGNSKRRQWLNS